MTRPRLLLPSLMTAPWWLAATAPDDRTAAATTRAATERTRVNRRSLFMIVPSEWLTFRLLETPQSPVYSARDIARRIPTGSDRVGVFRERMDLSNGRTTMRTETSNEFGAAEVPTELAYRASNGLEVLLMWDRGDGQLKVVVDDLRTGESFELAAATARRHSMSSITRLPMRPPAASAIAATHSPEVSPLGLSSRLLLPHAARPEDRDPGYDGVREGHGIPA